MKICGLGWWAQIRDVIDVSMSRVEGWPEHFCNLHPDHNDDPDSSHVCHCGMTLPRSIEADWM